MNHFFLLCAVTLPTVITSSLNAEPLVDEPKQCTYCEAWNQAQAPFKVYGNTYYVGVAGLSTILVTSDDGHILLDGGLPQSAAVIDANIRSLGFRTEDIHFIASSHAHYDHVGGIAKLQQITNAPAIASIAAAAVLNSGKVGEDDPQYGFGEQANGFPAVDDVRTINHGESITVGQLAVTAHYTPGHTSGGITWSWQSCEQQQCMQIVYADSLNAVSAPGYRYLDHPELVNQLGNSIDTVARLDCDILLAVHPNYFGIKDKLKQLEENPTHNPFIDNQACKQYAADANKKLNARIYEELQAEHEG